MCVTARVGVASAPPVLLPGCAQAKRFNVLEYLTTKLQAKLLQRDEVIVEPEDSLRLLLGVEVMVRPAKNVFMTQM